MNKYQYRGGVQSLISTPFNLQLFAYKEVSNPYKLNAEAGKEYRAKADITYNPILVTIKVYDTAKIYGTEDPLDKVKYECIPAFSGEHEEFNWIRDIGEISINRSGAEENLGIYDSELYADVRNKSPLATYTVENGNLAISDTLTNLTDKQIYSENFSYVYDGTDKSTLGTSVPLNPDSIFSRTDISLQNQGALEALMPGLYANQLKVDNEPLWITDDEGNIAYMVYYMDYGVIKITKQGLDPENPEPGEPDPLLPNSLLIEFPYPQPERGYHLGNDIINSCCLGIRVQCEFNQDNPLRLVPIDIYADPGYQLETLMIDDEVVRTYQDGVTADRYIVLSTTESKTMTVSATVSYRGPWVENEKVNVTCCSLSDIKKYDGSPLRHPLVYYYPTQFRGHNIIVDAEAIGSQTVVGSSGNPIKINKVYFEDGYDNAIIETDRIEGILSVYAQDAQNV